MLVSICAIPWKNGHVLRCRQSNCQHQLEVSTKRRAAASLFGEALTRIDDMALDYHHRVYKGYSDLGKVETERWVRINAAQTPEQVQADIVHELKKRLPEPVTK